MPDSKIHVHILRGCAPTPLAHYLKALGILRLVSEQADPDARGWWQDDVFRLATKLDRDELERFFLDDYEPTPMTASWLPRSGYVDSDRHRKTRESLENLLDAPNRRFDSFREIHQLMNRLAKQEGADLSDPSSMRTQSYVGQARSLCPKHVADWIDSCMVFNDDKPAYPAIFGTGGNEGSGSYLANYYVALCGVAIQKLGSIQQAMWGKGHSNESTVKYLNRQKFNAGHFSTNSGNDCPWSYVLTLEGILTLTSRLVRRTSDVVGGKELGTGASMASPFATGNACSGYSSAQSLDMKSRNSGSLIPGRGEQWFPIWSAPATQVEVSNFFREGKVFAKSDHRGARICRKSSDFARGLARMGASRGVEAFHRVGYFQRNGDNHMAIPLGRFKVRQARNQDLLDEVASWMDGLRRLASAKNAPESFDRVHRACEEAMFACTTNDDASTFLSLLIALGKAEDQMVHSPKFSAENYARPLPKLSSRWIDLALSAQHTVGSGFGSSEVRLALALATQRGQLESKGYPQSVRVHWVPLDGSYFAKGESGLLNGPLQGAVGLDLERACIAMINRRLVAMSSGASGIASESNKAESKTRTLPLYVPHHGFECSLHDLQMFLEHRVNDARVLAIARGFMAVDTSGYRGAESTLVDGTNSIHTHNPLGGMATYGVLRLALPNNKLRVFDPESNREHEIQVRCNPVVYRRLQTGNLGGAIEMARRQLASAGLRPRIHSAVGSPRSARRLAASMAFGIASRTFTRLAIGLTHPKISDNQQQELIEIDEAS